MILICLTTQRSVQCFCFHDSFLCISNLDPCVFFLRNFHLVFICSHCNNIIHETGTELKIMALKKFLEVALYIFECWQGIETKLKDVTLSNRKSGHNWERNVMYDVCAMYRVQILLVYSARCKSQVRVDGKMCFQA